MAARFWVGGTGVYSDTAHWASASGGAGGQTVPGTGDTATVDGHASGLNTGTLTIDQNVTVISFTWGSAIGTIDNSGNFNVTCSQAAGDAFAGQGTGARTWTGGSGTYTISGVAGRFTVATITNLTNPTTAFASASIVFSATSTTAPNQLLGGGLTYGSVTFSAGAVSAITGSNTIATLTVNAPNTLEFSNTQTVATLVANTGTISNPILFKSSSASGTATISDSTGTNTMDGVSFWGMAFTGGATFIGNNGLDFGRNSGITINNPSVGSGVVGVIGG